MQRLEATGDVDTTKARWKPVSRTKGGGAAARWGDAAAARCSIGGRRAELEGDLHGNLRRRTQTTVRVDRAARMEWITGERVINPIAREVEEAPLGGRRGGEEAERPA